MSNREASSTTIARWSWKVSKNVRIFSAYSSSQSNIFWLLFELVVLLFFVDDDEEEVSFELKVVAFADDALLLLLLFRNRSGKSLNL